MTVEGTRSRQRIKITIKEQLGTQTDDSRSGERKVESQRETPKVEAARHAKLDQKCYSRPHREMSRVLAEKYCRKCRELMAEHVQHLSVMTKIVHVAQPLSRDNDNRQQYK